jgi:hypothetical protein
LRFLVFCRDAEQVPPQGNRKEALEWCDLAYEEVDGYGTERIFHDNGAKYGNAHGLL